VDRLPGGYPTLPGLIRLSLTVVAIAVIYAVGVREAELDLPALVRGAPRGLALVRDFLSPDLFTRETSVTTIEFDFPVPCGSAAGAQIPESGPRIVPSVPCAAVGDSIVVEGFDLEPLSGIRLWWVLHGIADQRLRAGSETSDLAGHFQSEVSVRPIVAAQDGQASKLQAEVSSVVGGLAPSPALLETIDASILTLFMALIATSLAAIVALPISFLAAANITRHGTIGSAAYYLARSYLNITRTFEPLVLATVFGLWVGFGSFAGVLALTVFTIGSLGKLFSEAVESIDVGLIEAVTATGASRMQVIQYAVIPQVVPDFTSFSVYHWDINVRISTIIGFVGGGGIGFLLSQRISTFSYHKVGTALWAIVIIVSLLDLFSAQVRRRVI